MTFVTVAALLASIACVAAVDARYRLFAWRAPLPAALVLAAGVVFLLAWDAAGILLGIFFREPNAFSTGILLAPHLPLEEPVFLLFLCQLAMVGYTGCLRLLQSRTDRLGAEAQVETDTDTDGDAGVPVRHRTRAARGTGGSR
ncbi:lycopene cyclase domain-containing protein [Agromyces soli]